MFHVRCKWMSGINLIELTIAVSVVALTLSFAVPGYQWLIARTHLTTYSNELLGILMYARSEAIKRGARVALCKSLDGEACERNLYWEDGLLMYLDADQDGDRQPNEEKLLVHQGLVRGFTLRSGGNYRYGMAYHSSGASRGAGPGPGNNDTFRICPPNGDQQMARSIIVNIVGRARVKAGTLLCP